MDTVPGNMDFKELLGEMKNSLLEYLKSEPMDEAEREKKKKVQEMGMEIMKSLSNNNTIHHDVRETSKALQMTFTSSSDSGNSTMTSLTSPGVDLQGRNLWSLSNMTSNTPGVLSSFNYSPVTPTNIGIPFGFNFKGMRPSTPYFIPPASSTTRIRKISAARRASNPRLFSEQQINAMEVRYQKDWFIDKEEKEELSRKVGLTPKQIKDWFHHRRNRDKWV